MNTNVPAPVSKAATAVSIAQPKRPRKNPQRRKSEQAKGLGANSRQTDQPVPPVSRPAVKRAQTSPSKAASSGGNTLSPSASASATKANAGPQQPNAINAINELPRPQQNSGRNAQAVAIAPAAMVTGGLLGCAASAVILASAGIWHEYTSSDTAVLAVKAAKLCLDNTADEVIASLKAGTYSTEEALDVLRRTTLAYASTIPGGIAYVEKIFREITILRSDRGAEVDKVLKEAHAKLNLAVRQGVPAVEMRGIVVKQLGSLSGFASDSFRDVVDRNPSLKPYKDGSMKSLQGSPEPKVPTMKVNITMRHKKTAG